MNQERSRKAESYSLKDRKALADFLVDADIRLVRAEYLYELRRLNKPFPRRQEAQQEDSALVSHEHVLEWSTGKRDAIVCSVSHSWECREHPDPFGFQLENLVNCISLYDAAFFSAIWAFYDYVSLFQFERETAEEQESFQRAMANMHILYAHEHCLTFRLERLTPDEYWLNSEHRVPVYHLPSKSIQEVPVRDLVRNSVPYRDRGWCRAEIEWSSAKRDTKRNQQIDAVQGEPGADYTGKVPMTPEAFKEYMASSAFTHRDDAPAVIQLQEKIFHEKVTVCEEAQFENLREGEVVQLAKALPFYTSLRVLHLSNFEANEEAAHELGKALGALKVLEELSIRTRRKAIAKALARALEKNTAVTTIDLKGNRIGHEGAQALVRALEKNTNVTTIDLEGNEIGDEGSQALARALEKNTTITTINLRDNGINDEGAQALARALEKNTTVTTIDLAMNQVGDKGAQALASALEKNKSVTTVDLEGNLIGHEGAQALARALEKNTTITTIDLAMNQVGDKGVQALASALAKNKSVTTVDLEGTRISHEGAQVLASALEKSTSVAAINLKSNGVGDEGVQALARALEKNTVVATIDLEENEIGGEGAQALARALEKNTTITTINLRDNGINDEGAQALARALLNNTTITAIDLKSNSIEGGKALKSIEERIATNKASAEVEEANGNLDEPTLHDALSRRPCIQALAAALEENSSVTKIDFCYKKIGDEGLQALASALELNTSVTAIELRSSHIGGKGVQALARALEKHTAITTINLRFNGISHEGAQALARALEKNTTVSTIDLAMNQVGDEGVQALARALEKNTAVATIELEWNEIGDEGAQALARALEKNTAITTINLRFNRIGHEGAQALARALEKNTTVTTIDLAMNEVGDKGAQALKSIEERTARNKASAEGPTPLLTKQGSVPPSKRKSSHASATLASGLTLPARSSLLLLTSSQLLGGAKPYAHYVLPQVLVLCLATPAALGCSRDRY